MPHTAKVAQTVEPAAPQTRVTDTAQENASSIEHAQFQARMRGMNIPPNGSRASINQVVQRIEAGGQHPLQKHEDFMYLQRTIGNQAVVQMLDRMKAAETEDIHKTAAAGVQGTGGQLPHLSKIQQSFGQHNISGVQAFTGTKAATASKAIGAQAYTTGNKIAFSSPSPDLRTTAHEATHVLQQCAGVQLHGGVVKVGDSYERHADAVADEVAKGKSAEGLLNQQIGVQTKQISTQQQPMQQEDEEEFQALTDSTFTVADTVRRVLVGATVQRKCSECEEEQLQLQMLLQREEDLGETDTLEADARMLEQGEGKITKGSMDSCDPIDKGTVNECGNVGGCVEYDDKTKKLMKSLGGIEGLFASGKPVNIYHASAIAAFLIVAARLGTLDLWLTFLAGGSSGTMTLNSSLEDKFAEHEDTQKTTCFLVKKLQDEVFMKKRPLFLPIFFVLNKDVSTNIATAIEQINIKGGAYAMNFNGAATTAAGNIAGGVGEGKKPDKRLAKVSVDIVRLNNVSYEVSTKIEYTVEDTIDFCPGNCGSGVAQQVTVPLSRLEASKIAGKVPFRVSFVNNLEPFIITYGS